MTVSFIWKPFLKCCRLAEDPVMAVKVRPMWAVRANGNVTADNILDQLATWNMTPGTRRDKWGGAERWLYHFNCLKMYLKWVYCSLCRVGSFIALGRIPGQIICGSSWVLGPKFIADPVIFKTANIIFCGCLHFRVLGKVFGKKIFVGLFNQSLSCIEI